MIVALQSALLAAHGINGTTQNYASNMDTNNITERVQSLQRFYEGRSQVNEIIHQTQKYTI